MPYSPCTVPELTRRNDIKLTARVSLRRHPHPLYHCGTGQLFLVRDYPQASRQTITLRLGLVLIGKEIRRTARMVADALVNPGRQRGV